VASEWPPRYFVAECTTSEAPHCSGRQTAGEANVLSTTNGTPASRQTAPMAGRSETAVVGLAIVSAQTTAVSSRIAERTASTSVPSTNVALTSNRASTCSTTPKVPP
jgi:hypothetical protein